MEFWQWIVWFFGSAGIAVGWFAILEYRAFRKGAKLYTLSRAVWELFRAFPLAILLFNAVLFLMIGILMTHFFWQWCPPGSISSGG